MIRAVLATNRPSMHALLVGQIQQGRICASFVTMPLDQHQLDSYAAELDAATVALVDLGSDPDVGVQVCAEIRARRPNLRIVAVVCCPRPTLLWQLQELLASQVDEVFDAQAAPRDVVDALREPPGRSGTRLRLQHVYEAPTAQARPLAGTDRRLLALVTQGCSDDEIAAALHLSARAVRNQIQRLRGALGVRNREELAAWAGARSASRRVSMGSRRSSSCATTPASSTGSTAT